jgi:hypothetical protein
VSFGSAAGAYERFRPGYPAEFVDRVLAYAGRPIRTALEIGAGTGKATRVFTARGIAVTATDPDAAMLDELRRRVPDVAATICAPFEELPLDRTYDLVLAATSLHWTLPEGRWDRVAALLVTGGTFASVGGPIALADASLEEAVRVARSPFVPDDDVPSPDGTPSNQPMQWPGSEMVRSGRFVDVRQSRIERRMRVPSADLVGLLSTVSAYLVLPDESRRQVLAEVLRVLPDTVEVVADLALHLGRTV